MEVPGEKLIIKLWETLSEKGIGGLLRPWQIRREGFANIEMRRADALALAQIEREVKEIRDGTKSLDDFSLRLELPYRKKAPSIESRREPKVDIGDHLEFSTTRAKTEALRKEINVAKAVLHAEERAFDESAEPSDSIVNEDWLYRWRDFAGEVSSEDMQRLWGRVLSGEVNSPGSYSLRSLEFLRNLSQLEAKAIEKVSRLLVEKMIFADALLEADDEFGLDFAELAELEGLGVLLGVSGGGIHTSQAITTVGGRSLAILRSNDKCLVLRHEQPGALIQFTAYGVSAIGLQISSLGNFHTDLNYLTRVAKILIGAGFSVSIAEFENVGDQIRYFNEVPVEG